MACSGRFPFAAALGAALLAIACSSSERSDVAEAPDAAHGPTYAPTFPAVYTEVIGAHNCLLGLCHGEGASGGGLSLFPKSRTYDNLLVTSTSFECRALGLPAVDPGRPEGSLLWLKLHPDPPCGAQMPPDGRIDAAHVEQVRAWIASGAPED